MICAGANSGSRLPTVAAVLMFGLSACTTVSPAPVVFKAGPLSMPVPSAIAPGSAGGPSPVVATPPSAFMTDQRQQGTGVPVVAPVPSRTVTAAPLSTGGAPLTTVAVQSAPPVPRARPTATASASIGPGTYEVQAGETIFAVARKSNVAMRDLIEANGLASPYRLRAGQRIIIPQARYHRVRAGETLYAIARQYDVDMPSIVRANGLTAPYTVAAGQRLRLPERLTEASTPRNAAAPVRTATPARPPSSATAATAAGAPLPTVRPSAGRQIAAVPRAIPKPPPRSGRTFAWPVDGRVISRFGGKPGGMRNDGINIATRRGAPVRAAEDGVVAYTGNEIKGFGNMLLLRHADGWMTAYAHNETVLVKLGDRVRRGQVVARVGSSGSVTSPQLHFEIRKGTVAVDPTRHLDSRSASNGGGGPRAGLSGGRPNPG